MENNNRAKISLDKDIPEDFVREVVQEEEEEEKLASTDKKILIEQSM